AGGDTPPCRRPTAPERRVRDGAVAAGRRRRRPRRPGEARCCVRAYRAPPTSPRTARNRGDARRSGAAPACVVSAGAGRRTRAPGPSLAVRLHLPCAFTWLAMNRTVSGGTSPMAVIL